MSGNDNWNKYLHWVIYVLHDVTTYQVSFIVAITNITESVEIVPKVKSTVLNSLYDYVCTELLIKIISWDIYIHYM